MGRHSAEKGLGVSKRWWLSGMRYGVVLAMGFANNNGFRYFEQAWLRKATDIGEGKGECKLD